MDNTRQYSLYLTFSLFALFQVYLLANSSFPYALDL